MINSCKNVTCSRGLIGSVQFSSFPTTFSETIYNPKICYMLGGQLVRRSELCTGTNQGVPENEKASNLSVWKFGYNSHLLNIKDAVASDNGSDPIAQEINECLSCDFSRIGTCPTSSHSIDFLLPPPSLFTFNSFSSFLHLLLLVRSIIFIWGSKFLEFNTIIITC